MCGEVEYKSLYFQITGQERDVRRNGAQIIFIRFYDVVFRYSQLRTCRACYLATPTKFSFCSTCSVSQIVCMFVSEPDVILHFCQWSAREPDN